MTIDQAIRRLDRLQAELTIHPDGCPEPWRSWLVKAHEAMCHVIEQYREEQG